MFRLRNVTSDTIALSFPNSCQVLPYITTPQVDRVVYLSGGAWGCLAVVTSLVLAPGAAHVTTVLVRASAQATDPAIPLLRGEYRAYARLGTIRFRVD